MKIYNITEDNKECKNIIVFIHGFIGSKATWFENNREPKILIKYLLQNEIISKNYHYTIYDYESTLFSILKRNRIYSLIKSYGFKKKTKFPLAVKSVMKNLDFRIESSLEKYTNLIFVCHSLGGIIGKYYISNQLAKRKSGKVKLYITLATPHLGTDIANKAHHFFKNPQLLDLSTINDDLVDLNREWINLEHEVGLPDREYFVAQYDKVVPKGAGGIDTKEAKISDVQADHSSIINVESQKDDIVIGLTKTLSDFISKIKSTSENIFTSIYCSNIESIELQRTNISIYPEYKQFYKGSNFKLLDDNLKNNSPVLNLVSGRPDIGKTRTVLNWIKEHQGVFVYPFQIFKTKDLDVKKIISKEVFLFIDEIDKYELKSLRKLIYLIISNVESYTIVATTRKENVKTISNNPELGLATNLIEFKSISKEEASIISNLVGTNYDHKLFDGTPGSVLSNYQKLKTIYETLNANTKYVLKGIKFLNFLKIGISPNNVQNVLENAFNIEDFVKSRTKLSVELSTLISKGFLSKRENRFILNNEKYLDQCVYDYHPLTDKRELNSFIDYQKTIIGYNSLLRISYSLYYQKEYWLSKNSLDALLEIDSTNVDALYLLIDCYTAIAKRFKSKLRPDLAKKNMVKAEVLLNELTNLSEPSDRLHYQCAYVKQQSSTYLDNKEDIFQKQNEALEFLSKALSINPKHIPSLRSKGYILEKMNLTEEAIKIYKICIDNSPYDNINYFLLGRIHQKRKEYEEAIIYYEKCLKIKEHKNALHNMGVIYMNLYVDATKNRQFEKRKYLYDMAESYLIKADKLNSSKDIVVRQNLSRLYSSSKQLKKAIEIQKSIVNQRPSYIESYSAIAHTFTKMKDFDNAITYLVKGLSLSKKDNLTMTFQLAVAYSSRIENNYIEEDFNEAEKLFKSIISKNAHYSAYKGLAILYEKANLHEKANNFYLQNLKIPKLKKHLIGSYFQYLSKLDKSNAFKMIINEAKFIHTLKRNDFIRLFNRVAIALADDSSFIKEYNHNLDKLLIYFVTKSPKYFDGYRALGSYYRQMTIVEQDPSIRKIYYQKEMTNYENAILKLPKKRKTFLKRIASIHYRKFETNHNIDELKKAIEILNSIIIDHPYYPGAYMDLGLILSSTGKHISAIENLEKAKEIYESMKADRSPDIQIIDLALLESRKLSVTNDNDRITPLS